MFNNLYFSIYSNHIINLARPYSSSACLARPLAKQKNNSQLASGPANHLAARIEMWLGIHFHHFCDSQTLPTVPPHLAYPHCECVVCSV